MPDMTHRDTPTNLDETSSGFVADGYERLVNAHEIDARRIVEAKYADEWNASGIVRRWKLQRKMDAEIAEIVARSVPDVSLETLF